MRFLLPPIDLITRQLNTMKKNRQNCIINYRYFIINFKTGKTKQTCTYQ